jgi:protein TonB
MTQISRSVLVFPLAIATSAVMFLAMVLLVHSNDVELQPTRTALPDIVANISEPEDIFEPPIEPPSPPTQTPTPPPRGPKEPTHSGPVIGTPPTAPPPPSITPPHKASSTLLPLATVSAVYPNRAKQRGIEGYVDVMFDVTARGRTENCRILEARTTSGSATNAFNRAACAAVAQFRYRVPSVSGVARGVANQRTRFTFSLEN